MGDEPLPDQLMNKYKYKKDAQALFFKNVYNDPSFRFEIPSLGWEFSDGFWVGPDPQGIFYYNDDFDDLQNPTQADYYVDQWMSKKVELYAHITFYVAGSGNTTVLAEFLGRDDFNVTESSGLLHQRKQGTWKEIDYVVGNATASKNPYDTTITVRCPPLRKEATFNCSTDDEIYGETVNTKGQLTIKDIKAVNDAHSVRWYHDYVVFHKGVNATEFAAFFFPRESRAANPLGTENDARWHHVEWTDN